jgi:hypothetical protein
LCKVAIDHRVGNAIIVTIPAIITLPENISRGIVSGGLLGLARGD